MVKVLNDDLSVSVNDATVVEGNTPGDDGRVDMVFTVSLSTASGQTVNVNYATADGTATQPADYTNTSGTLTFSIGTTTQTITVPVIGETVPEANETFFVNVTNVSGATVGSGTASVAKRRLLFSIGRVMPEPKSGTKGTMAQEQGKP